LRCACGDKPFVFLSLPQSFGYYEELPWSRFLVGGIEMGRWFLCLILTVAVGLASRSAQAQTFWTGGVNTNWDAATFNWVSGSPLVGSAYSDGKAVEFGDTNPVTGGVVANVGGLASIAIQPAGVLPASVRFTNSGPGQAGVNYLIGGGPIMGATGLTLLGTDGLGGSVALTSANSFSGPVSVQAGRLNLSNVLAVGNSTGVTVGTGAALELQSSGGGAAVFGRTADASTPIPLSLAGPGFAGGGALANLSGNNSYAGPITVGAGSGGTTISSTAALPGSSLTLNGGISVAAGATLTLAGPGETLISSGALSLAATTAAGSAALNVNGPGTAEIDSPSTLGAGSSLAINGGTLRFNLTAGSPMIGSGVTASVSSGGTLELAGTISALANGSSRVDIVNNSTAAGVVVTGTGQLVGGIDGAGDVHVTAGADLTANHIIQNALIIGGTDSSPALVTIAASDGSGSPLVAVSNPISSSAIPHSPSFAAGALGGNSLLSANNPISAVSLAGSEAVGVASFNSESGASVPEPSSLAMIVGLFASLAVLIFVRKKPAREPAMAVGSTVRDLSNV
jgi:fibronectin-binding autotransporter adhesin